MQETAQSRFCNIGVMTQNFTNGSNNVYFFGKSQQFAYRLSCYLFINSLPLAKFKSVIFSKNIQNNSQNRLF